MIIFISESVPTTVSDPASPPPSSDPFFMPKIVGLFRIIPFSIAFAYQLTLKEGREPLPPMPNGALPPDTLICGSFRLLKILPMERGKKPLILLMIPLIVDFAELIGEIMAFLIFDHAELAADLMLPHADESVDLIACTGEVTAVLMLLQIELAVDLMLLHTEEAVLLIPFHRDERPLFTARIGVSIAVFIPLNTLAASDLSPFQRPDVKLLIPFQIFFQLVPNQLSTVFVTFFIVFRAAERTL